MNSSCESEPQRSFTFPGFKVDSMDEELRVLCITRQKKSTDFVSQQTQRPATNQTQSCVFAIISAPSSGPCLQVAESVTCPRRPPRGSNTESLSNFHKGILPKLSGRCAVRSPRARPPRHARGKWTGLAESSIKATRPP
jgi:hypothetical protein